MLIVKVFVGLIVGVLVGLTGMGGGVLLLPLLVFGLGVPPIIAVGSDAAFNFFTKIGSAWLHWRRGTIRWGLVASLVIGSVPGTFCGVALLRYLLATYGNGVNNVLRDLVGLLLIIIPCLLLVQELRQPKELTPRRSNQGSRQKIIAIGFLSGISVGVTSIGSGTITMMLLLLVCPYSPIMVVGTDIMHAVVVTGFSSLLHVQLGTVDSRLLLALLAGSIPGGLLGTRLSTRVPGHWLRRILGAVLLLTGARMLWI